MRFARLGLVALLPLLVAPHASAQRETFEDETSTILVEVPVTVVYDGAPVRDLERAAFHVFDRRTERDLVDFEVIDLETVSTAAVGDPLALPQAARRHFMLLFDFQFSRPGAIARARDAARELVRDLHPSDLVSVATYSVHGPRLLLGFTPDRRQVDYALSHLGLAQSPGDSSDPLGLTLAAPADLAAGLGGRASERSSDADGALSDMPGLARRVDRDYAVYQVTGMTRAFSDLAQVLDAAEGKKHLVYLTEGFDSRLMTGGTTPDGDIASLRGDRGTVDSRDTFGDPRVLSSLDRMLQEFRRSDVTIQVVDIHGLETANSSRRLNQQALFYIANETGGELYESYNDLGAALGKMLERTSVTYLLTFRADDLPEDGAYHRLRVEVDGLPRRARVSHRAGYSAPRPADDQPALAQRLTAAQELLSPEPLADFSLATLMIPFPLTDSAPHTGGATAHVPVVVEVDGEGFLAGFDGTLTFAEVFVYALDSGGGVLDHFAQRIPVDVYRSGSKLRRTGLRTGGHLELPAGSHTVRVLVRNGRSGAASLQVTTLEVASPGVDSPTLLPPFFPETSGTWVMGPDAARATASGDHDPFALGGGRFLPAVRPRWRADQTVPVGLVAYGLGAPEQLQLSTRVLDGSGRPAGRAVLRLEDRASDPDDDVERLLARLETADLAAGLYQLEVTLIDPETGREATSTAPFRIEPPTG